ncbi:MAG: AMMECR1 domain-containing protein [Candidatus Omnitrophota bacterium]|nr:MAG: AMMECR1 domain-containing protein [Candidatus Omnitrophota bacterium]
MSQVDEEESESQDLSFSEKKRLLEVARNSIGVYLRKRERMEIKEANPRLLKKRGVFVTLKKNGNLRGCIGYIQPVKPLIEAVRDMAIEAAFNDPRFSPLQEKEMKEIEIEISVLSPLRRVEDIKEIKVGRDGLLIRKGFSSGLLLPQVATEYNWDREEFLMHTCYKAGLSPDAWREGAEIYTFTAEVFTEGEIEKDR